MGLNGQSLCLRMWLLCFCAVRGGIVSIVELGAIQDDTGVVAARVNGQVLWRALSEAEAGSTVLVPGGASFYMIPKGSLTGLNESVTLRIDGALVAHDEITAWPVPHFGKPYLSFLSLSNTNGFSIVGEGVINGQGHAWWWAFLLGDLEGDKRPLLLELVNCSKVAVVEVALLDAPRFNVYLGEYTRGAVVRGVAILVDASAQQRLHDVAKALDAPMFPFNTDGVDVQGSDVLIEDCVINNYDDVIAVKASDKGRCTERVLVRNLTVFLGAGLSIGSVHPNADAPCVRDIAFSDVQMYSPLKGVYVKPDLATDEACFNGGARCSALIANVSYQDIDMHQSQRPPGWADFENATRRRGLGDGLIKVSQQRVAFDAALAGAEKEAAALSTSQPTVRDDYECSASNYFCMMWPIFVGTQQQLEPDGSGSGIWAPTEPRVTIDGLTLRRVKAHGGVWPMSAAVIRCNATNPCTNLVFDDVVIDADLFGTGRKWICDDGQSAFGQVHGDADPDATACVSAKPQAE